MFVIYECCADKKAIALPVRIRLSFVVVGMLCCSPVSYCCPMFRKAVFDVCIDALTVVVGVLLEVALDSRRCAAGEGPSTRTGRVVVVRAARLLLDVGVGTIWNRRTQNVSTRFRTDGNCGVLTSELLSLRIVDERRQRRMLIALIARSRVLAVVRLLMHQMLRRMVRITVLLLQLLVLVRIVSGVMVAALCSRTGRGGGHQLLGDGRPQNCLLSVDLIAIAQHFVRHTASAFRAYILFEFVHNFRHRFCVSGTYRIAVLFPLPPPPMPPLTLLFTRKLPPGESSVPRDELTPVSVESRAPAFM